MPGYTADIMGHKGKKIARATLRTPGEWDKLSAEEKALWNQATRAINNLLDHYNPEE